MPKLLKSDLFHLAVQVAIMAIFWILPPFGESLTPIGMKLLGVFIASCYGWTTVGIMWPTILAFCVLPFTGATTQAQLLIDGVANVVFLFLIFIFMLNVLVDESGLAVFLANFAMSRKFIQGRPWVLILIFMLVTYVMGSVCNPFLVMFLMWSITYGIADTVGYQKKDPVPALLVTLTTCCMLMGYSTFPFHGIAVILIQGFQNITGIAITYPQYLMWSIPMGFGTVLLMWLFARFILRPDVSKLQNYDPSTIDPEKLVLSKKGKIVLAALLSFIVLLLSGNFLDPSNPIAIFVKTAGNWGVIAFILLVLVFVKVDGEPVLDIAHCFKEGVKFEILMCCAYLLPLGTYMANANSGIPGFFMEILTPILGGMSPLMIGIIIGIASLILTQFMTNMVVAYMFFPVIFAFSQIMPINPVAGALVSIYACHVAMATPAACSYAAITYANSDWVDSKQVMKYSASTFVLAGLIMIVFGVFWGNIVA